MDSTIRPQATTASVAGPTFATPKSYLNHILNAPQSSPSVAASLDQRGVPGHGSSAQPTIPNLRPEFVDLRLPNVGVIYILPGNVRMLLEVASEFNRWIIDLIVVNNMQWSGFSLKFGRDHYKPIVAQGCCWERDRLDKAVERAGSSYVGQLGSLVGKGWRLLIETLRGR